MKQQLDRSTKRQMAPFFGRDMQHLCTLENWINFMVQEYATWYNGRYYYYDDYPLYYHVLMDESLYSFDLFRFNGRGAYLDEILYMTSTVRSVG